MVESEYLNTEELSIMLNVSKKSIEKWRSQNRLPGQLKCGRVFRFRRLEVEKRLLSGQLLLPVNKD